MYKKYLHITCVNIKLKERIIFETHKSDLIILLYVIVVITGSLSNAMIINDLLL